MLVESAETAHLGHQNVHFDKRSTELTPKSQSTFCVSPVGVWRQTVSRIPYLLSVFVMRQ